jgi:hypothetical protein
MMPATYLTDPVEVLYLGLMLRWEKTAPKDKHWGLLDDVPECNSQKARLAYVLRKIAAGNGSFFPRMSLLTRRRDGRSYVSCDHSWMSDPCVLLDGWYLHGCMSLEQKQEMVSAVVKLGHSPLFGAALDDFIEGKSVRRYMPTPEQQEEIVRSLALAA